MYTIELKDAKSNMISLVGRKSAYLGEVINLGFNVPKGFVITSRAFQRFISNIKDEIDEILSAVNINRIEEIEVKSQRIKNLILKTEIPEDISSEILERAKELGNDYLAVRSTVTSPLSGPSFAGEYDTYLFVSKDEILNVVRRVWASYYNVRAIAYRIATGDYSPIAVLVQKMINSRSAGTAITLHPITEEQDYVFIESAWGLGEAVTRGMVTPDQVIVSKASRKIVARRNSEKSIMLTYDFVEKKVKSLSLIGTEMYSKPSISESEAIKIANFGIALENFFKRPVNIEWAIDENNEIYLLEVRGYRKVISSEY
ncbi:MAG: PEP/pyruvate-binding domain-containing protein [Sulfolobaceae archaeon]